MEVTLTITCSDRLFGLLENFGQMLRVESTRVVSAMTEPTPTPAQEAPQAPAIDPTPAQEAPKATAALTVADLRKTILATRQRLIPGYDDANADTKNPVYKGIQQQIAATIAEITGGKGKTLASMPEENRGAFVDTLEHLATDDSGNVIISAAF